MKKTPGIGELYQTSKEEIIPILQSFYRKLEGNFPTHSMMAEFTLLTKPKILQNKKTTD